ncbi:MAG: hypothetical protein K6E69_00950 [Treponema sp.]|uniref:hypothetical protein n=1 Tax=Treponema sp. TaxID=166 RepID=UPI00298DC6A9|nr:hypothetical protein [Treponema sp.]MCR5385664.1 hypothetical protein [Treponema sp.]
MKRKTILIILSCLFISQSSSEDFRSYLSYRYFYEAVYGKDFEWVKNHLKAGYDPEKCKGEAGWVDSIPLKVVVETLHSYIIDGQNSDTMIIDLLIQYGADVNRLPYVWDRIYLYNDFDIIEERYKNNYKKDGILYEGAVKEKEEREWVAKINRVIEKLLLAGADPNMKGHPFPFGTSWQLLFFTDKKAFKYFNSKEATTPLYEAIKKGMKWESQVDLLLKYGATLDESCLEAAKLSGDAAMLEKIEKLLKI